jgi:hypothetical protein
MKVILKLLTSLIYLLTDSMQKSPSWKANQFSHSQEIPHILYKPKAHYHIHKCPVTTAWRVLKLRVEEPTPKLRVAANILNKQLQTAYKGWSSSLGLGKVLTTPHNKIMPCYEPFTDLPHVNITETMGLILCICLISCNILCNFLYNNKLYVCFYCFKEFV